MASQVSGVRLAERMEEDIEKLVEAGIYLSTSEFIREAVREKLLSTSVKTLPDDIAENEIRWFLQEKRKTGQNLVSIIEISQELMLPPGQTERIMSRLKGVKEV